jgi:hypothetical protein
MNMNLQKFLSDNWLQIANVVAFTVAILDFLFGLGVLSENPEWFVSGLALLNTVAALFGLKPIPGPTRSNAILARSLLADGSTPISGGSLAQTLRENWFIILNIFAIVTVVLSSLADFGWVDQYPSWYLSIVASGNFIALLFGLPQIPEPEDS